MFYSFNIFREKIFISFRLYCAKHNPNNTNVGKWLFCFLRTVDWFWLMWKHIPVYYIIGSDKACYRFGSGVIFVQLQFDEMCVEETWAESDYHLAIIWHKENYKEKCLPVG